MLCALAADAKAQEGRYGPAYLVYAGPYASSPSSAFGHLFLALAAEPDQPPPLWRVVTFNAETFGANPIRYLTVGIAGGFLGRFTEVSFHEKTRDYGVLDDRDLWMVQLELTAEERIRLEEAIDRERGAWHPYTFFSRNCAFYLQLLIAEVTGAVATPSGIVSPTDVVHTVVQSRLGGRTVFRPSASARIRASVARSDDHLFRSTMKGSDWLSLAADTAWQSGLSARELGTLVDFMGLRRANHRTRIPDSVQSGLARIRVLATDRGNADLPERTMRGVSVETPRFHRYSRLRLVGLQLPSHDGALGIEFRGAMHDGFDPWFGHRPANSLELLGFELTAPRRNLSDVRIERVTLFSQRALPPRDWVRPRSSWMLELQGRRGGVLSREGFHLEVRGGNGVTYALPFQTYAYGLLTLGFVGAVDRGVAFVPGVEFGAVADVGSRLRGGIRWSQERDATDWSSRAEWLDAWIRFDVVARIGLLARLRRGPAGRTLSAGLDWYP